MLGTLSCAAGQTVHWDGSVWVCADDLDTDTVAALSCSAGQTVHWDGSAWVCADDLDTDTDSLAALSVSCSAGQTVHWNGSAWVCADSGGADTLAGLSCSSGQTAKWSGSAWVCANDIDIDTDNDTLAGLVCADGDVVKWTGGVWACGLDAVGTSPSDTLAELSCDAGQIAKWNGTAWGCAADDDTLPPTPAETFAGLLPQDGTGSGLDADMVDGLHASDLINTDTLAELSCSNGQVAKWNGTSWTCAADSTTPNPGDLFAAVLQLDGPGSGLNADRLDGLNSTEFAPAAHDHAGVYQPVLRRTVIVSPVGAGTDARANGSALLAAVGSIVAANENRWLVKIEPGIYDLGDTPLVVPGYVDIEGSGIGSTFVRGNGASTVTDGAIVLVIHQSDTEIRSLTVLENVPATPAWTTAVGIYTEGSPLQTFLRLRDVQIVLRQATSERIGVHTFSNSFVGIKDSIIDVGSGAGSAYGVGTTALVNNVHIRVEDSTILALTTAVSVPSGAVCDVYRSRLDTEVSCPTANCVYVHSDYSPYANNGGCAP